MTRHGPIVVATDLTADADEAVRQAQVVALIVGAPLIVCHVLREAFRVRVLFPQNAGTSTHDEHALQARALKAVASRTHQVLGLTDAPMAIEVVFGSPHAGILEVAERLVAGLIVLGPGSTALQVSRAAHCPVLIARLSPDHGTVCGATDFSDPALPAIRTAAAVALRRGVPLRVVHCLDLEPDAMSWAGATASMMMPEMLPAPEAINDLESRAREQLRDAIEQVGAQGEAIVLRGSPAQGILSVARQSLTGLIVVGTRGRTGLSRLMLGSVAEEVIRLAPCSVMVVRLHQGPVTLDAEISLPLQEGAS